MHQGAKPNKNQWKRQRGTAKKESREHMHQGATPNKRPMEAANRGRKKGVARTHASGPKDWRWPSPREAVSSNTSDQGNAS